MEIRRISLTLTLFAVNVARVYLGSACAVSALAILKRHLLCLLWSILKTPTVADQSEHDCAIRCGGNHYYSVPQMLL